MRSPAQSDGSLQVCTYIELRRAKTATGGALKEIHWRSCFLHASHSKLSITCSKRQCTHTSNATGYARRKRKSIGGCRSAPQFKVALADHLGDANGRAFATFACAAILPPHSDRLYRSGPVIRPKSRPDNQDSPRPDVGLRSWDTKTAPQRRLCCDDFNP